MPMQTGAGQLPPEGQGMPSAIGAGTSGGYGGVRNEARETPPAPVPPFPFTHADYSLAPLTLYHIGGAARYALLPPDADAAAEAYAWLCEQRCPKLILGGGSNILISDDGFPGIVLVTSKLTRIRELDGHRYEVEAGVVLDELVRAVMLKHNYAGVGGLTGIPGSVGGAIYMNAGTVSGTTCQLMEWVDVAGPLGMKRISMEPELYGYRGQTFCRPGELILRGLFRFEIASDPQRPIYDRYIQRRKEKQPQGHCCGSVFKNPEGDHAGRLIEACGLKGTRAGGAVISPLHANFIMNDNNARCADVLALIELCKTRVREKFGVDLREEVVIVR